MDSKSISRKGVGVRLPSLAPANDGDALATVAEALGKRLVPALCRRLRLATVELTALEARLAEDPATTLADEPLARRHAELSSELTRAGYCLGVLGAGGRADLLRERRERQGLRWFLAECATAHGAALAPEATQLPELVPAGARGGRLALLSGWCVARAASQTPVVRWEDAAGELVFVLDRPLALSERREARALGLSAATRALALALS